MDRDFQYGASRLERLSVAESITSTAFDSRSQDDPGTPRVSYVLPASPITKTAPDGVEFSDGEAQTIPELPQNGALRAGDVPNLYSRRYIGLLVQYAAIGLIYGALPRTVYPFLNNYLHMNGYQTLSARVLLSMPWSIKVFIGMLSDCFPICGSRRRAYMVLGWLACSAMLLVLVVRSQGPPFYVDRSLRGQDLSSLSKDELVGRIFWAAPEEGATYIVFMMLASCGYMLADVASDGLVVEFAQREPEAERGNIQSTIYLVRSVFMIFAALLVGFGLNGVDYGGSFSWSLNMSQLLLICAILSLGAIPTALWLLHEPAVAPEDTRSVRAYIAQLWILFQNCAMLQIMAYRFFSGIFEGFTVTAGDPIQRYWAHVHPLNESLFSVLGLCVFSAALYGTKRYGLQWNWRNVIAGTLVIVLCIDAVVASLTIWNVVRSQWFWLGTPILEELPAAVNFLVSTFVVVEMAEQGNEAAVYGLLTTISNLASPFASCLSKNVNARFDVSVDDIISDSTHVRWQVTWTFLIAYVMKLFSLTWLVLLPRQKRETQELKQRAGHSRLGGCLALGIGAFALIWSITTNLMSIFPATACLAVAGGSGC
ncbi:hypothetical protein Poli38472_012745 [Pythium oligandrum]|uniref:Transmembrane protein n=1 Tax=Pythium oligandrum TaxID=41045 RepID=A0A8K1CDR4_PYTOL|nr:hypothetical protein Poli38472_012745 [Pythium oligandrum]|eukprot:TMW61554.1 hypothetical protein Poli38472_012745 [Pythium oligandrum]